MPGKHRPKRQPGVLIYNLTVLAMSAVIMSSAGILALMR